MRAVKDYPAISALGGVIHSLMMLMPWLGFAKSEKTVATIQDPMDTLYEENDRALWEMVNGDHGQWDMDEYDDGELVATTQG